MKDRTQSLAGTVEMRPVDVTAWRRGCCPVRSTELEVGCLNDDFDFDPAVLDADTAIRFQAIAGLARRGVSKVGFAFCGRDSAVHWIAMDTDTTALEVHPVASPRERPDGECGLDGDESGTFFPESGDPIAFGREGQPRLSVLLAGNYVPPGEASPVSPMGTYQVDGDDPPPIVRNPMHDDGPRGLPRDRCGLAACLPPWASVVTNMGMKPATRVCDGDVLRTETDGWQPVSWVRIPKTAAIRQPVYLATAKGMAVSPNSPVGRILLVSGRISSRTERAR